MALLRPARLHAQKKTAHAAEQQRPDVLIRREAWFDGQLDLDPERLVFVDESWASTNMARRYGRCPRGERLRMAVPHGHWKTTTLIAGMRSSGVVAPCVIDSPVNRKRGDQARLPVRTADMVGRPGAGSFEPKLWSTLVTTRRAVGIAV